MALKAVNILLIGVFSISLSAAHAQEAASETKTEKPAGGAGGGGDKKRTKIDFEDELVEGELKKPELFYLLQKKQFNFKTRRSVSISS